VVSFRRIVAVSMVNQMYKTNPTPFKSSALLLRPDPTQQPSSTGESVDWGLELDLSLSVERGGDDCWAGTEQGAVYIEVLKVISSLRCSVK
jgi:hypothetical protein